MITAANLHKSFGSTRAVNGINLNIAPGEIYGLVGADGAGKTTTLRLLCGALRPDQGSVTIAGLDMERQTEQAREQIGYLSQRFSMYEDLTVLENIRFFAEVRGLSAEEWYPRSLEILEFVGLADFKNRFAGQLSGGMKQKLGLASALVTRPRVLLLDEPTTGVDPVTRQDFWQLIIHLVSQAASHPTDSSTAQADDRSTSIIISTPYMDEAARCHRVGFLQAGQIIAEGAPAQLRSRLEGQILELQGSPLRQLRRLAAQIAGVQDVQAFGDRLHLRVEKDQSEKIQQELRQKFLSEQIHESSLRLVPASLEDVFIALSQSG